MTSLEQLICQRDILHSGKFSFLTGETYFMHECVRGDSGYLQIQQGWPKSPETCPAVLWYPGHVVWTWGARNGRWCQELEWICKVVMSYQPEKQSSDWSVLMLQIETARKGRYTVIPWRPCVKGLESIVSGNMGSLFLWSKQEKLREVTQGDLGRRGLGSGQLHRCWQVVFLDLISYTLSFQLFGSPLCPGVDLVSAN